ncbi:MAG TPA: protoporphyrinogen oxidase [Polyangia bacterium]|nr:protoporphyrinogen oxidase [Polyangia bacterium]
MRVLIVGGGISGLATAHLAAARGHDVALIDDAATPGGLIGSVRRDGFLCERGPQAVLDGPEETRALIASAGLSDRLLRAAPAARRRFVYVGGALRPFPASPPALIKTDLLSAGGKLRLLAEPFVGRAADDESVLAFVTRRFGREAAERAAAPALIGVFAGDAAALSVRTALPRVAAMEREHGSILRALMRKKKGGPGMGSPVSFPDGLSELPAALARSLGARRTQGRAMEIAPISQNLGGWRVVTAAGATVDGDRLVLATPAGTTAALLARLAPDAAAALRAIPHAPVAVVCLGFRSADGLGVDLDAYGFVVARGQGVSLLGCQYETSVFTDRAPAGGVLLRALLGGTFEPELVDADDGALAARAIGDLRRTAGLTRDPDFVDVWRARPGIPQYDLGHAERIRTVDAAVAQIPGLAVIGNALRGVGVNDGIAAATRLAAELSPTAPS